MIGRLDIAAGLRKTAICALAAFFASPLMAQDFPVSRCMNLGAALEAPREGDWGYVIRKEDMARIADAGFDTVRLPVKFSAHFDGTRIDPDLLDRVDEVIGWARAEGLTVILDLHHFDALMQDPEGEAGRFLAIWTALSQHYAGAPKDLIFELLNEPFGALDTAGAVALYDQVRPVIRKHHPDRWIITGGGVWNDHEELAGMPPAGPFEAHTFHYYRPWTFTHQQASYLDDPPPAESWGSATDIATVHADISTAARHPAPLFLGEFGSYDAGPERDRAVWTRTVRQAAERHGIAWCYWGFSQGDNSGFQAYDQGVEAWRAWTLDALLDE